SYKFIDQTIIDGFLNRIGGYAMAVGTAFRKYFDAPVVNGFGDFVGEGSKRLGKFLAPVIQRGRIQYYMLASLIVAVIIAVVYFFTLA
ncbi:MAG: hypothetical protein ACK2TS_02215, partial [Anaerolineales bacterium]